MQIACPACAATYQVPEAMIGAGRQMRCVRCGEDWFAPPAPDLAAVPEQPPVAQVEALPLAPPPPAISPAPILPAPAAQESAQPTARRSSALLLLAWLVSAVIWLVALYALWAWREPLSELWPPIVRLYALLGLA